MRIMYFEAILFYEKKESRKQRFSALVYTVNLKITFLVNFSLKFRQQVC